MALGNVPTNISPSPSQGGTSFTPPAIPDEKVALFTDFIIAASITTFIVWRVLSTSFGRSGDFTKHLLGSIRLGYRPLVRPDSISGLASKFSFRSGEQSIKYAISDKDGSPSALHIHYRHTNVRLPQGREGELKPASIIFTLRNAISSGLNLRINSRRSVAQVLVIIAYSAGILVSLNFRSQIFSHPIRAGWIVASQIPFLYAFATKNNIVGYLGGYGYEKLQYIHRLVGRWMFIAALLHSFGFIFKWSILKTWPEKITLDFVRWGLVTFTSLSLLWLLSIQPVRQVAHRFFYATHVVGSVIFLVALSKHAPASRPYVVTAIVLYGVDHLIRLLKTRITTANIRVVPELGLCCMEIPTINEGWRAGQHVRLRILSSGMGLWGALEAHPFTISTIPGTNQGLVIICKKVGPWTSKLYDTANSSVRGEQGGAIDKSVRVMVEGPYGGTGYSVISKHSAVMLIVGGTGVTFALSAILEIMQCKESCNVRVIHVVWCVPTPASISPLIALFRFLVAATTNGNICLRIRIFYTRAPMTSPDFSDMPLEITITPGRPQLEIVLDRFVSASAKCRGDKDSTFIGVCGPRTLAKDVAEVVRTLDVNRKSAVGGIHLHEEMFEF